VAPDATWVEGLDGGVDRLVGGDIGGGAVMVEGDGVEQEGVDVESDAKGEDRDGLCGTLLEVRQDGGGVDHTLGGQAVGEEQHIGGPACLGRHATARRSILVSTGARGLACLRRPGGAGRATVAVVDSVEGDDSKRSSGLVAEDTGTS
jgi:hypothetical protein